MNKYLTSIFKGNPHKPYKKQSNSSGRSTRLERLFIALRYSSIGKCTDLRLKVRFNLSKSKFRSNFPIPSPNYSIQVICSIQSDLIRPFKCPTVLNIRVKRPTPSQNNRVYRYNYLETKSRVITWLFSHMDLHWDFLAYFQQRIFQNFLM